MFFLFLSNDLLDWMICWWNHLHMRRPVANFLFIPQNKLLIFPLLPTRPSRPHLHLPQLMARLVRYRPPPSSDGDYCVIAVLWGPRRQAYFITWHKQRCTYYRCYLYRSFRFLKLALFQFELFARSDFSLTNKSHHTSFPSYIFGLMTGKPLELNMPLRFLHNICQAQSLVMRWATKHRLPFEGYK